MSILNDAYHLTIGRDGTRDYLRVDGTGPPMEWLAKSGEAKRCVGLGDKFLCEIHDGSGAVLMTLSPKTAAIASKTGLRRWDFLPYHNVIVASFGGAGAQMHFENGTVLDEIPLPVLGVNAAFIDKTIALAHGSVLVQIDLKTGSKKETDLPIVADRLLWDSQGRTLVVLRIRGSKGTYCHTTYSETITWACGIVDLNMENRTTGRVSPLGYSK